MIIGNLVLSNPVLLAPMAGITDLPYRRLMKKFGASLVFTEMVSANGLHYGGGGTLDLLRSSPDEHPLGVQIFGSEPDFLAEAARKVAPHGDLLDINMGCPVKKVIRGGAGSALLQEPRRVREILRAVRRAVDLPLTIKIRSGWDDATRNFLDIARIAEDEGVDAITLHPRTRSEGFSGHSDWDEITRLKSCTTLPVIGSGDLFSVDDALAMFEQTGCDAVMIGRGGYGNPWLVSNLLARLAGKSETEPDAAERYRVLMLHLDLFLETFTREQAVRDMRKHLCWYTHALPGSAAFRRNVNRTRTFEELNELIESFFAPLVEGKS